MLLVIWAHCSLPFANIIGFFHMPLFFCISGYLFKDAEPKKYFIKKLKTLYIPFVIYELIFLVFRNIFLKRKLYSAAEWSWMLPIRDIHILVKLLEHIFLFDNVDELLATFWFLTALFNSTLIYFIINRIVKNQYIKLLVCFLFFIIAFVLTHFHIAISWSYNFSSIISTTLVAIFYVALGHFIRNNSFLEKMKSNFSKVPYIELFGILFLALAHKLGLKGAMLDNSYNCALGFLLCSIVGIITWTMLMYRIYVLTSDFSRIIYFFKYIGINSIHFMAVQYLAMKPASFLLLMIDKFAGKVGDFGLASGLSKPYRFVGFIICVIVCYFITKIILICKRKLMEYKNVSFQH